MSFNSFNVERFGDFFKEVWGFFEKLGRIEEFKIFESKVSLCHSGENILIPPEYEIFK